MIFFIVWVLLLAAPLSATIQYIEQQGLYVLASDIIGDDVTTGNGIITVSGSNVTIDLDGHTITQGTGTNSPVYGIYCTPDIKNVVIKNGIIRNVSGSGIQIGAGCSNITIENIACVDCFGGFATVLGAPLSESSGITIDQCSFTISTTVGLSHIVSATQCSDLLIQDLIIHDISASEATLNAIGIYNCSGVAIKDTTITGITTKNLVGIKLEQSAHSTIDSCCIHDCKTTETGIGIAVSNTEDISIIETDVYNLVSLDNNTESIGYSCNNAEGCSYIGCVARSIEAQGSQSASFGFKIIDSDRVFQQRCIISFIKTTGNGSNAYGIVWSNISLSALIKSIIDDTQGANEGFGMIATSVSESEINGNQFLNTSGGTLRRGLRVISGTRNLFTKNIAFRNGNSATEQIEGLASGTTDFNTATGNISTIGSPWTNIRAF